MICHSCTYPTVDLALVCSTSKCDQPINKHVRKNNKIDIIPH